MLGAAAFATALGIAALLLDARSGGLAMLSGSLGVLALVVLGAALVLGQSALIGWSLGLLALQYAERLVATGEANLWVPAVAGLGLLLVGELSQWSIDSRSLVRPRIRLHVARAMAIGSLLTIGAATVLVCLLTIVVPISSTPWATIGAVVAIVGVIVVFGAAARRRLRGPEPA
jgi:hypothetical protein